MATVNLHPSSTVSNDWTISGGAGTVHENLADSDDSSLIRDNAINAISVVELDDYTAGGTIDSIRFYVRGVMYNTRSGNVDIQVKLVGASGDLYNETVTLNFTGGYAPEDHYGTARETSDGGSGGSSAWTDSDLDALRLNINTSIEDPPAVSFAQVNKAYVEVTYTSAVEDNAVFFGTNF